MPRSIISLDSISGSYDVSDSLLVNGANLIVSGTLSVTGSAYLRNTQIDGQLTSTGISGSLTKLADGTSYLIAGSSVSITSSSNGAVTISSTAAAGNPSALAYNGYCSGSLLWNSTTWADFRTVPSNFIDTVQSGIIRSGSTFTVASGGVYFLHCDFPHQNQLSYMGLRVSGSPVSSGLGLRIL